VITFASYKSSAVFRNWSLREFQILIIVFNAFFSSIFNNIINNNNNNTNTINNTNNRYF